MTTRALSIALLLAAAAFLPACNGGSEPGPSNSGGGDAAEPIATPEAGTTFTLPSGRSSVPPIKVTVIEKGDGMRARAGDTVALHYTGTFLDGREFDSSKGGSPFEFRIGHGGAIEGWQIVAGQMRIGDRWKAVIPYGLAYGERGHPAGIPGRTDLVFDMQLVRIR
jgi:FKBP-type peptidyl-prolyl cis-trans isomerase